MKNLLISLILFLLPVSLCGQIQYISSNLSFLYPNDYVEKHTRNIQEVSVKLVPKEGYGTLRTDNIIIHLSNQYSSLNQIKKDEFLRLLKKENELGFKQMGITNFTWTPISYEKKTVSGKQVISILTKTDMPDYDIYMYQLQYIYVQNGKSCFITLSYDVGNDNYKSKINYILKSLEIL
ncbi:MAG: hypothetical protein CMD23_03030 [Flavobacteriales bacterium]|nr:hypothetical protein [Flavobacteriales bacterium]|tara:strand:+ start:354 stop:890 length:537 start_codon:yes stop_codon:yes gene_type:complete